ncbi:MAG: NAD-dependent deacylase [Chloroflexota bacterium]
MATDIEQLTLAADLICRASYLTALTGAGMSTASGIPDFRHPESGLWEQADTMQVASMAAFRQNPAPFFEWVRPLLAKIVAARPNPAHRALVSLSERGPLCAIITQNVDNLHGVAGSDPVYELHGHLRTATCTHCFKKYDANGIVKDFLATGEIPRCDCPDRSVIKPDVILFGEQLPVNAVYNARRAIMNADVLLIAGSSLQVAPANHLPRLAYEYGTRIIIVNQEPTPADRLADVILRGDVTEILPGLIECVDSQL